MSDFKYQELQRNLEKGIREGIYKDKLPSVRSLAKTKEVSIATVQKSYEALERMGLVEAKPKRGYFVRVKEHLTIGDYGSKYHRVTNKDALEKQVLLSLNDSNSLPLSSTAPSSVINNEPILSKHHRKAFDRAIYRFQIEDEVQGFSLLRQSLSQLMHRQGQSIAPDNIHITSGRREGLFIALVATQTLGGEIAVESPTSFYFQSSINRLCSSVIEIPMQHDFQQELNILDAAQKEHGFSVYLVNPSFQDPTGRLLSDTDKLALLKWAKKRNVTLIEYDRSELYIGETKPKSLTHLSEQVKGVRVIGIYDFFDTISTRICLGYLISVNMGDAVGDAKYPLTEEPNLNTQKLVNSLISSGDYEKILEKLRPQLRKNYHNALQILTTHLPDSVQFSPVMGGPCLWLKSENKSSLDIWQELIEQNVAIAPGCMCGFNTSFDNYFRITFALPWNTDLALALVKVCKAAG